MSAERISATIKADRDKLAKLLHTASDDRPVLVRLVEKPIEEFRNAGIDLEKYFKTPQDKKRIIDDVDAIVKGILGNEIKQGLLGIVESTDYTKSTSSSYEYNFDHSSSTDYKYESHTGSDRGTFSETSTGEATNTDRGFAGIGLKQFSEFMLGPLISEKAVELIQQQFEKTVSFTAQNE